MRLSVVCPLCGVTVYQDRFSVLRWPIRALKRIMGGRYPHSKIGKIVFEPAETPQDLNQQLIARLEELAHGLGYELKPVELANRDRFVVPSADRLPASERLTFNLPGVR